jgi:hypothetical protein
MPGRAHGRSLARAVAGPAQRVTGRSGYRGTWLIWSVLAIVVCLSQRADGASWSLIMAAAQAVLTSAVFLLSTRRGEGGLSPADMLMIALAGGVIGWI